MLLCCVMLMGSFFSTAMAEVFQDEHGYWHYEPEEQGRYSDGGYKIDKIPHPTLGPGKVDGILTGEEQDRGNSYS